jgi:hypothetical protein
MKAKSEKGHELSKYICSVGGGGGGSGSEIVLDDKCKDHRQMLHLPDNLFSGSVTPPAPP